MNNNEYNNDDNTVKEPGRPVCPECNYINDYTTAIGEGAICDDCGQSYEVFPCDIYDSDAISRAQSEMIALRRAHIRKEAPWILS